MNIKRFKALRQATAKFVRVSQPPVAEELLAKSEQEEYKIRVQIHSLGEKHKAQRDTCKNLCIKYQTSISAAAAGI